MNQSLVTHRSSASTLLLVALFFALPLYASAAPSPFGNRQQEPIRASESNFYLPPAIFVDGITIPQSSIQAGNEFSGSFKIVSGEDATISDITYRIELLSKKTAEGEQNTVVEDLATVYDRVLVDKTIALAPNEIRDIPFTYDSPLVPGGEYRLRIQLVTSKDKTLGWDDATLTVEPNNLLYADLAPGNITIPEYDNKGFSPDSGPNITPEKPFSLHAFASPAGTSDITLTPVLDIFAFSEGNKKLETRTLNPVLLPANTSTPIEIPMTALAAPGVYTASLTLQNPSTQIKSSSLATYRWVVRGNNAQILGIRLISTSDKKDAKIEAEVNVAGPADAETILRAKLNFEIKDDSGVAGKLNVSNTFVLNDAVSSGIANITLDRDLQSNPKLHAMLVSEAGEPLDSYTVDLPLTNKTAQGGIPLPYQIAIGVTFAVLLLIAIVVYAMKKKRPAIVPVAILTLLSLGSIYSYHTTTVSATNGVVVNSAPNAEDVDREWRFLGSTPVVQMFINRPIHNNTYPKNAVPLQLSVSYAVCANRVGGTVIYADYLRNGGKISTQAPPSGNSFARSWFSGTTFIKDCNEDDCGQNFGGPGGRYLVSGTYSGTFNFDQLSASAINTTLRLFAKWDWNMETNYPSNYPSNKNVDTTTGEINVINLWVNVPPTSDLSITKTGPGSVVKGQNVVYTVAVRNDGPAAATNVVVTDTIPAGLTFRSASSAPSGTTCTPSGSNVTCTIPAITSAATTNITLTFGTSASTGTCAAASIQNSATITSSDSSDPINTNNSSTATTSLTCPVPVTVNLTVNGSDTPPATTVGTPITLAWTSTNATTCTATTDWTGAKGVNGSEAVTPTTVRTHTYVITCTNATSGLTGTDTVSIVTNAAATPNQSPIAVAKLSKNGEPAATTITVTRGVAVTIALDASGSSDPDGWTMPGKGMSVGGKCEWNSDLNQGAPTFDTVISNVPSAALCNTNAVPFSRTFNDNPGTYTYNLLRLTDAAGGVSSNGTVSVTVVAASTPTPTATITPVAGNNAPISVARISINGSTPTTSATVTKGQAVSILLNAASSSDPDGWNTPIKGVAVGGKCEWNSNLNQGVPIFDQTIPSPANPASCNISLGTLTFNDNPGTYTYNLLRITDALGAVSNNGAISITVLPGASTPTPTATITPVVGNNPPLSVATMNVNGGAYSKAITVSKGVPVQITLSANGSSDPDGWTTAGKGMSTGGKCEWNSNLNQGAPIFETTIPNPLSAAACSINLGSLTFNDNPGTYTYNLLRLTDAAGAASTSVGSTTVTVIAGPTPTPTVTPTPTATPTPAPAVSPSATPIFNPGPFTEGR